MASYIVAVSGGVDSVVLLDALVKGRAVGNTEIELDGKNGSIIVAHFDHGIRSDSQDDATLVRKIADKYGLRFETKREELGADASEQLARTRRYDFLMGLSARHSAKIITAHHANDVCESVAINIARGTGWRGVAVMDSTMVLRPLLRTTKAEIREYALKNALQWHEDSTNENEKYLRNRIRKRVDDEDIVWQVAALRARQVELKQQIDNEIANLRLESPYSRYFFGHCGDDVALELLRSIFVRETGISPVVEARRRALTAVKVALPGRRTQVGGGISLRFTKTHFVVETAL